MGTTLQSYLTERGLLLRQRAHSDTCFPSKRSHGARRKKKRDTHTHGTKTRFKCYRGPADRYEQGGGKYSHSLSIEMCDNMQPLNKCHETAGGKSIKRINSIAMVNSSIVYVCVCVCVAFFGIPALFHQCGRTFTNKANAKSSVCVLIKFKSPRGAVRGAEGTLKKNKQKKTI